MISRNFVALFIAVSLCVFAKNGDAQDSDGVKFFDTLVNPSSVKDSVSPTAEAESVLKDLPTDSKLLLERLASFEKAEIEAAQKRIDAKREDVRNALKDHMARETKAGHVDQAIALKTITNRSAPKTDLSGSIWCAIKGSNLHSMDFTDSETVIWTSVKPDKPANRVTCGYSVKSDEILIYYAGDKKRVNAFKTSGSRFVSDYLIFTQIFDHKTPVVSFQKN